MQVGLRRLDGFMPEPQRDHGAGCATEAVVRRAALSALERGYRVQVPVDARDGLSARTENAALRQIEAAGGASILARCARLLGLPMLHSVVPQGGKAPWRSRATRRRSSRCPRRSGLRRLRGSWRHCRGHLLAHGLLDHGPAGALRTAFLTTALRTAFLATALRTAFFAAAFLTAFFWHRISSQLSPCVASLSFACFAHEFFARCSGVSEGTFVLIPRKSSMSAKQLRDKMTIELSRAHRHRCAVFRRRKRTPRAQSDVAVDSCR